MSNVNNAVATSFSLMSMCQKMTFDGPNFSEWIRYIRMIARYEDKDMPSTRSSKISIRKSLLPKKWLSLRPMSVMQ